MFFVAHHVTTASSRCWCSVANRQQPTDHNLATLRVATKAFETKFHKISYLQLHFCLQMRRLRTRAGRNMGSRQRLPNGCKQGDDFKELNSVPPQQILPIHDRQLYVDPQKNSPLYDGTIPAEIRDRIFFYAVQEFFKTNSSSIWPLDTKYTRPGYTGLRKVDISLLLTCRRVYLETYHLPVLAKEHYFFYDPGTGPDFHGHNGPQLLDYESERDYFVKLQPWQLSLVKEIHFFTQMFWLELKFPMKCRQGFMRGIEKLRITIRKTDWWWNERNHPLVINPYRDTAQFQSSIGQMHKDIAAQVRGDLFPLPNNVWGSAFKNLPSLKELEIEFETSDDKRHELDTIVKWAKTWKFPLHDGRLLSTEGLEVTSSSWQSPFCCWSHQCPYCGSYHRSHCNSEGTPNEEKCAERAALRFSGLGPKCHIYSVRWKVVLEMNDPRAD